MATNWKELEIGAAWKNDDGSLYIVLNKEYVGKGRAYPNKFKKEGDKSPDLRIYRLPDQQEQPEQHQRDKDFAKKAVADEVPF